MSNQPTLPELEEPISDQEMELLKSAVNFRDSYRVNPSPFIKRKSLIGYFTKDVTEGTCERGERSDLTGCTPTNRTASPQKKKPKKETTPKQSQEESSIPVKKKADRSVKLVKAERIGKGKEAKVVLATGETAPSHITSAMIPPAWSKVKISLDPDSDILAQGKMKDKKGNWANRTVYNAKYLANNAAAKFAKVQEGLTKFQEMYDENQHNRKSNDPKDREAADCVWLMQEQATRPGSDADTKGLEELYGQPITKENIIIKEKTTGKKVKKTTTSVFLKVGDKEIPIRDDGTKQELIRRVESGESLEDSTFWLKSHGATTLEARHIVETEEGVRARFVGKETVFHDHLIRNPNLATMLLERKKKGGKLFDIDYNDVSKYAQTLDGGMFTPKDFRTMKATKMAIDEINKRKDCCDDSEEYQKAVMDVAEKVSNVLGNRPQQALESYISPMVWSVWRNPTDDNSDSGEKSLQNYETKDGYTGKKKDKLGHTQCYSDGVHVPCEQDEQSQEKPSKQEESIESEEKPKPDTSKPIEDQVGDWVKQYMDYGGAWDESAMDEKEIAAWDAAYEEGNDKVSKPPGYDKRKETQSKNQQRVNPPSGLTDREKRKEQRKQARSDFKEAVQSVFKDYPNNDLTGDEVLIDVGSGRELRLEYRSEDRSVFVDFAQSRIDDISPKVEGPSGWNSISRNLQHGTMEFARVLGKFVDKIGNAGLNVAYETTEPRRERLYARVLNSSGFERIPSDDDYEVMWKKKKQRNDNSSDRSTKVKPSPFKKD